MDIGSRIKELRKKQGLNQSELGKVLDLTPSAMSLIEAGKNNPTPEAIVKLCDFFGISTDYLLTGKEGTTEISAEEQELINLYREDGQVREVLKNTLELKKKTLDQLSNLTTK